MSANLRLRENMSYKNSLSKKVHKYTFLGLNLYFVLNISGLWSHEVGVLCCRSTPEVHRQVSIYARRFSQGVSGSMFLTATARDSESTAEDGEERFGTNFTFAKDRRSESKLSKSAGYALGFAAWFCRLVCKNYELLGWCCRAGRSTSYHAISQFFTLLLFYPFTFLLFYSLLPGGQSVCLPEKP